MMRWIFGPMAAALVGVPSVALAADGDWSGLYAGAEAGAASGGLRASGSDQVFQLSNINVPGRGIVVVPGTSVPSGGSGTETNLVYGGLLGGQWQTGGLILGIEG